MGIGIFQLTGNGTIASDTNLAAFNKIEDRQIDRYLMTQQFHTQQYNPRKTLLYIKRGSIMITAELLIRKELEVT